MKVVGYLEEEHQESDRPEAFWGRKCHWDWGGSAQWCQIAQQFPPPCSVALPGAQSAPLCSHPPHRSYTAAEYKACPRWWCYSRPVTYSPPWSADTSPNPQTSSSLCRTACPPFLSYKAEPRPRVPSCCCTCTGTAPSQPRWPPPRGSLWCCSGGCWRLGYPQVSSRWTGFGCGQGWCRSCESTLWGPHTWSCSRCCTRISPPVGPLRSPPPRLQAPLQPSPSKQTPFSSTVAQGEGFPNFIKIRYELNYASMTFYLGWVLVSYVWCGLNISAVWEESFSN